MPDRSSAPPARKWADRAWSAAPTALRLLAEGGWITVLYYAFVVSVEHRTPLLNPIEFAILVGLGVVIVRYAATDDELGPYLLFGAVVLAGVAGWALSSEARDLILLDPASAVGIHAAGWLAGLAVLRGILIGRDGIDARHTEGLATWALPGLALLWLFGHFLTPPEWQETFTSGAFLGSALLIAAVILALGLYRLDALRVGASDPRQLRVWRWLVIACAAAVVTLAIPFGLLTGVPVGTLLEPVAALLLLVLGVLAIPFGFLAELLASYVQRYQPDPEAANAQIAQINSATDLKLEPSQVGTWIGIVLLIIILVIVAIAILELARWMLAKPTDDRSDRALVDDGLEHAIVVPERPTSSIAPRVRARRRGPAHNAVTAYVDALADLETRPAFARAPFETPAAHSLRTRRADMPDWTDFARLAADYQLATYGQRALTATEDRRALGRLQRLRRRLRESPSAR